MCHMDNCMVIHFRQYLWPKCENFMATISKTCVITINIHMAT